MLQRICARLLRSRLFAANQVVCDRGRGEYRRVSTDQHAEQQREDEPADHFAAEQEDGQQHDQRRTGSIDRAGQRRVDRIIDVVLDVAFRIERLVLADTVENHR